MLPDSTSTSSNDTKKSEESLLCLHHHRVRGLPDVFAPTSGLIRSSSARSCQEISIRFDGKEYICRICHGGDSSGDLLTPCKCKGTIALTHLKCLEIWLNESNRSECELCRYHFRIIRQPKYNILWSIFVFLRNPGDCLRELLIDTVTLVVYTPSTITSTYMLMLLCDSIAKSSDKFRKTFVSHLLAFTAIFGIAAINFTYTSWLVQTVEKYVCHWSEWYKKNSTVKVVLSSNTLNAQAPNSNCAPPPRGICTS